MFQAIVVKLKKSPRVLNILELLGMADEGHTPIFLTNKIYETAELDLIQSYFYKRFTELNLVENWESLELRREFLTKKLKLPHGLELNDVIGFLNQLKPFKKLRHEDCVIAGVAMERMIISGVARYNLINYMPKQNRCLYVFELNEKVKLDQYYLKQNPNWDNIKPAFYVGQTAKSREERYAQHLRGEKSNRFMKKYGIKPFSRANKTHTMNAILGVPVDNLRYYQALYYESKLTVLLKEKGYGAYSN